MLWLIIIAMESVSEWSGSVGEQLDLRLAAPWRPLHVSGDEF